MLIIGICIGIIIEGLAVMLAWAIEKHEKNTKKYYDELEEIGKEIENFEDEYESFFIND